MLSRIGALLALILGLLVLVEPPAIADEDPPLNCPPGTVPSNPGGGWICVPVVDPGEPPDGGGGGGGTNNTGGGGEGPATCHDPAGVKIPCTSELGVWFAEYGCYANAIPDPPPGDIRWGGNDPAEGAIYLCNNPLDGDPLFFFLPNGQNPVLIDPAVLAQRALDQMKLATPNIHTAPQPPDMTYVGLETWLWMDPGQWNTLDLMVTAGATSVTVTAKPTRATWELTTGSTTCTSPGSAWVDGMSNAAETDCSYTWEQTSDGQAEDAFPISSTITYQVDWTCSGACLTGAGTLGEVDGLPGAAAIRVGERQSVVIGGSGS
jgi:hypothetical protein